MAMCDEEVGISLQILSGPVVPLIASCDHFLVLLMT